MCIFYYPSRDLTGARKGKRKKKTVCSNNK